MKDREANLVAAAEQDHIDYVALFTAFVASLSYWSVSKI